MIKMHTLLTEITLDGVTPYVTQFAWRKAGEWRETEFQADDIAITLSMVPEPHNEWSFAILTPTRDGQGHTVAHSRSAAVGQVSYLRLMATVAEALLDFATQWQPAAIDVTGSDTASTAKDLQKTRIYRSLLHANAVKLLRIGYGVLDRSGKLYIVRSTRADSTGVAEQS